MACSCAWSRIVEAVHVWRRIALSLAVGTGAGVAAAFVLAIVIAVVDLWLAGHGYPSLRRPWLDAPAWGVHLSRADVMFLAGTVLAAVAAGGSVAICWKRVDKR